MKDDYLKQSVTISKKDVTGENEVTGAELTLTSDEVDWTTIIKANADNTRLETVTNELDEVIGVKWVSDGTDITIQSILNGEYTLTETATENQPVDENGNIYKVISSALTFTMQDGTITLSDNNTGLTTENTNHGYYDVSDFENSHITVCDAEIETMKISKQTVTSTDELAGAELTLNRVETLTDEEGNETQQFTTVKSWTSTDEAETFSLQEGTYQLVETGAPQGYAYSEEIIFTVDNRGIVTIEGNTVSDNTVVMTDKALQMSISKQKIGGEELKDAELTLYRMDEITDENGDTIEKRVEVESWTSGDEAHEVDGSLLIADADYVLT
ncbi:MAG: SpaA isopeptide-forming pilin-related protein [Oscillospiraceae bacterium]